MTLTFTFYYSNTRRLRRYYRQRFCFPLIVYNTKLNYSEKNKVILNIDIKSDDINVSSLLMRFTLLLRSDEFA